MSIDETSAPTASAASEDLERRVAELEAELAATRSKLERYRSLVDHDVELGDQLPKVDLRDLTGPEEARQRLARSEEKYRAIIEQLDDGILLIDDTIIDCNSAACRHLMSSREYLIGRRPADMSPPTQSSGEDSEALQAALWERAYAGEPQSFEWQIFSEEGELKRLEVRLQRVLIEDRAFLVGIGRDVTARRRTEERLRLLSTAIDRSINAFGILTPDAKFEYVNQAYLDLFGFESLDDVLATPPAKTLTNPRQGVEIMEALKDKGHGRFEITVLRKDGTPLDLLLDAFLWRDEQGRGFVGGTAVDVTEERRISTLLARSEERHRLAEAAAGITVWERNLGTGGFQTSPNAAIVLGWDPDTFAPSGAFAALVHPDDQAAWQAHTEEVLHRSGRHQLELRLRQPDGSYRWLSVLSQLQPEVEGPRQRVLGTITDISARKETEARLKESEAILQAALDNSQAGIAIANAPDGVIEYVNEAGLRIGGSDAKTLKEGVNTERYPDVWGIHHLDGRKFDPGEAPLARALQGEHCAAEFIVRRRSGEERHVWANAAPILDERSEVVAAIVVFLDITERRDAERALLVSQRSLSTLMRNLPGMAYRAWSEPLGELQYVSDGCQALTGYSAAELTGEIRYGELILGEHRVDVHTAMRDALDRREVYELTYPIRTASGAHRWMWERGRAIDTEEGSVHLEGFIFDVTEQTLAHQERERLESQLRQAQKMEAIGQLAGGVAHDFNNILTAVLGNVELALDELGAPEARLADVTDSVEQIEKSARRAAKLTRQLLAFSRRQVIQPRRVNLDDTLRDLEHMLGRLLNEDIDLSLQFSEDPVYVRVDPSSLEQAIVNLVVNAKDAMPDGGRLHLSTGSVIVDDDLTAAHPEMETGLHVRLRVEDSGGGMDDATKERAFEPFFTTKPVDQGTGLGLSMVYGFMRQSGGTVTFASQVGTGTRFDLYWPADVSGSEDLPTEKAATPISSGSGTLLLCEDDEAVLALTQRMLTDSGYEVLVATSPLAAIELAHNYDGEIALLVTDVIMPQMNGRKLSDALHAERPDLQTLYISGYTADAIAHHGVLDEGVHFLEKPFTRQDILRKIGCVLE